MTGIRNHIASRRAFLISGAAAGAMVLLPGCAGGGDELGGMAGGLGGLGGAFSLADVLRRLLTLASQNAFERLTEPGEFWDEFMAELDLAEKTGGTANALSRMLTSGPFKAQLEHQFAIVAANASAEAAPLVYRGARNVLTNDATELLRKKRGAVTGFLREEMGDALTNVIMPNVDEGLRAASDPELGQLFGSLADEEVDPAPIASWLGEKIEEAIWDEIAAEETAIREDPKRSRDFLLIRVFGNG